jgi:hypothetical protein
VDFARAPRRTARKKGSGYENVTLAGLAPSAEARFSVACEPAFIQMERVGGPRMSSIHLSQRRSEDYTGMQRGQARFFTYRFLALRRH